MIFKWANTIDFWQDNYLEKENIFEYFLTILVLENVCSFIKLDTVRIVVLFITINGAIFHIIGHYRSRRSDISLARDIWRFVH